MMEKEANKASLDIPGTVSRRGALDMQVCVPKEWGDEQVVALAEQENPCGTASGWGIRRGDDRLLNGAKEREPCEALPDTHVHIMLDA